MTTATTKRASEHKRDFWWWLTAILAPIGILGGPIAIAEMLNGFIEWHGPIGYVVSWWGAHISVPFHGIFVWLAGLLSIDLPPWTKWITDYVALGILLSWNFLRAFALFPWSGQQPMSKEFLALSFSAGLLWPVFVIWLLFPAIRQRARMHEAVEVAREWPEDARDDLFRTVRDMFTSEWLTLAPFILFLVLWGLNAFIPAPTVAS